MLQCVSMLLRSVILYYSIICSRSLTPLLAGPAGPGWAGWTWLKLAGSGRTGLAELLAIVRAIIWHMAIVVAKLPDVYPGSGGFGQNSKQFSDTLIHYEGFLANISVKSEGLIIKTLETPALQSEETVQRAACME